MPTTRTRPKTTKADATAAGRRVTSRAKATKDDPALGEHPDTLGIIHRAMNSAAKKAVAENDHLGIPTPGTDEHGRIVLRQPPKKAGRRTPEQG